MKTEFKIDIAGQVLEDLKTRLAETRWPDEIEESGWNYGTNLAYTKELCQYWQNNFEWRKQEDYLNSFTHYQSEIDNFRLHYIYEKGKGSHNIPLLLTHGYPDSFVRFLKIIPLLTQADENGFAFDVVIPSIPGYGFSEKPSKKGMDPAKIATLFARLMTEELGYQQFTAHGGDWGSTITEQLITHFPKQITAIHLTDVPYKHIFNIPTDELSEEEKKYMEEGKKWQMQEGAYAMIQGTKPQTLAYGINDSPAGLAAWIIEKFRTWSDCDGAIESRFSKDELLTNITIYWVTETANSAFRIYYESFHMQDSGNTKKPQTPVGLTTFPKDIVPTPKQFAERIFNLKYFSNMPEGGHFAAMETPELLASEIRKFFIIESNNT
ncbi:epoxide hydrolase family protein [Dyadobacter subterraneus]|uniref:Epoxide hydrolase n=1 Tax=Dyadobacter subterraneus TaxID=2773304 RepID=A0ABR9W914_9BACT|nr:epoxide hydrolase family protein [Dyadobacter subterraneus]MBE9461431.1 epoxide hydrolase [Dyadobacter subterraneus]